MTEGHDLYGLSAGDRPAPVDNPPEWSVPILSPPPVATAYLWSGWLPDPIAFYLVWAIGLAAIAALGTVVMTSAPLIFVPVLGYVGPNLAVTGWSGNVNAWIGLVAVIAWWACQRHSRPLYVLIGGLVALAAAVKIGPAMLGLWLLGQARWAAVAAAVAAGLGLGILTVVAAGPAVFGEYFSVVREAASMPTSLSVSGILGGFGLGQSLQTVGLLLTLLIAAALILVLRRSRLSFAVAVVAMVYATTVVRAEAVAVAIAVMAVPWIRPEPAAIDALNPAAVSPPMRISRSAVVAIGIGVVFAVGSVGVSMATGGLTRSSLVVTNTTGEPVIARVSLYVQSANFGYLIEPGRSSYGWFDRFGASPPVVSIWTPNCRLIEFLWLPREGSHVEVDAGGASLDDDDVSPVEYAQYAPDCAAELIEFMDAAKLSPRG